MYYAMYIFLLNNIIWTILLEAYIIYKEYSQNNDTCTHDDIINRKVDYDHGE